MLAAEELYDALTAIWRATISPDGEVKTVRDADEMDRAYALATIALLKAGYLSPEVETPHAG